MKKKSKPVVSRTRKKSAQKPAPKRKRENYGGMKKGQFTKLIAPHNSTDEYGNGLSNYDLMRWGRAAKNLKALRTFGAIEDCIYERETRPCKIDLRKFGGKWCVLRVLDCSTTPTAREVMLKLESAVKKLDSQFFRDLADVVDAQKEALENGFAVPQTAPAWIAVEEAYLSFFSDVPRPPITFSNLLNRISERNPEGMDERQVRRIVKALGLHLEREKPGPKPDRRKNAGKGRE